jgi:ABC-type nickel/cobalt efflux system permease component RcnA
VIPLSFALGLALGCLLTLAGLYLAARRAIKRAIR